MSKSPKSRSSRDFTVRFWGVRGSFPVSGEGFLHYGGNTSCVEVRAGDHLVICDMGTGIIRLGNDLLRDHLDSRGRGKKKRAIEPVILVTHAHHDHTQGLPFFKPAYLDSARIHIFGPRMFNQDFSEILAKSMMAPLFPVDLADMASTRVIRNVEESETLILKKGEAPRIASAQHNQFPADPGAVVVRILKNLSHPKGGVINYRISYKGKSVVYATDVEGYVGGDSRLVQFTQGADLLIHDAQYLPEEYTGMPLPTQGFGHSTYEMAAAVAHQAGVGRLALFHHDPTHTDEEIRLIEKKTVRAFKRSFAAYEGQEVSF
jgi:phosphoribosyl 1,2-cyclic phosphodiesterase